MSPKRSRIDESTLIPLSVLSVIVAIVFWAATLQGRIAAAEVDNGRQDLFLEKQDKSLEEVRESLARIEGKIDTIMRRR